MACIEVIEWPLVEVIRSWSWPISSASVGWYPTAEGIRPSSVDTSEPAWVNRKMLSMNSSTSWPCTSRKYSAMVSADRPTRSRTPGGSSLWPKTSAVSLITFDSVISMNRSLPSRGRPPTPAHTQTPPDPRRLVKLAEDGRGVLDHVRLGHLDEQVVALAGPLPHPGEHRDAAEVLRDPGDHLLDEHRLAHTRAAEQADLAALDVRREQVEDLDAGFQDLGPRLQLVEGRRVAVDRPALIDLQGGGRHIQRVAEHVEQMPLGHVADRNRDRAPGVGDSGSPDQAIGGRHGDGPDRVVAQVLFHLERQGPGFLSQRHVHWERVVEDR